MPRGSISHRGKGLLLDVAGYQEAEGWSVARLLMTAITEPGLTAALEWARGARQDGCAEAETT